MRRVSTFKRLRLPSLLQIATIGLLFLAAPIRAADQPFDVIVTADSTRVMAGEKPIGEVRKGTRLTVSQTNADWYLIDLPNANPPKQGWVRRDDVRTEAAAAAVARPTPEQRQARLKERDRYGAEVDRLYDAGKFDEAVPVAEKMLAIEREVLGSDSDDAVSSLSYLASIQQARGDFADARKLFEEVLAAKTKRFGNDAWQVIDARLAVERVGQLSLLTADQRSKLEAADKLQTQVIALFGQKNNAAAIPLAKQVFEERNAILGEMAPLTAGSASWLGSLYDAAGDHQQAALWHEKAAAMWARVAGKHHPNYATSVNNLACCYLYSGDYLQAEPLFRQALEIRKSALGEAHADYRQTLHSLSNLLAKCAAKHEAADDLAAARKEREEAVAIHVKLFGKENWQAVNARIALAHVEQLSRLSAEQRRQLSDAAKLAAEANALAEREKYPEAIGLATKAFDLRHGIASDDDILTANSADQLGFLNNKARHYAEGEKWTRMAVDIFQRLYGERHPNYAIGLDNLAFYAEWHGDYAKAESLYKQELAILRETIGESTAEYAATLDSLAMMYVKRGDYTKAEPLYRQALAIRKKVLGEKNPNYANTLNDLAILYDDTGDYAQAELLNKQALEIRKEVLGTKHARYATSLLNLAIVYDHMGDYVRAEPLCRQAVAIGKDAQGEKAPDYAIELKSLAELYGDMGDYAKAEPLYREALAIVKQSLGEKTTEYANTLIGLAILYDKLGNYAQAEPLYQQTLAIEKEVLGEKSPDYATAQNNLAILYADSGEYAKAETAYKKVLAIRKEVLGERHPYYASSLSNLALLYHFLGRYAEAEPLCKQALEIRKEVLGEQHPDYASSLNNLASLYATRGDYASAEPLALKAFTIAHERLNRSASVQSERQQLSMANDVRFYFNHYLSITTRAVAPAEQVYDQVLTWKGAVSARQQTARRMRQYLEAGQSSEVAHLFADLAAASRELANQSLVIPTPDDADAHQQRVAKLSDRVEELQRELAAKSSEFHLQLAQQRRTSADLRRILPAGTTLVDLVEYFDNLAASKGKVDKALWEQRLVAFVVRADKPVDRVELGPEAPIQDSIEAWRRSFGMATSNARPEPGQEIRRLVWDKLEPHLEGATTILISPDGATARLPWGALPGKQPGSYLDEERAFAVVPIPRLLPELLADNTNQISSPSLLTVGDIDFGADPGRAVSTTFDRSAPRGDAPLHWQPLPGTAAEVAAVKAAFALHYPGFAPEELARATATKRAVANEMTKCRYLHFSTHGFFAPPQIKSAMAGTGRQELAGLGALLTRQDVSGYHPDLLSGLVLAGANRPAVEGQEDGILTALEVSGLDLGRVDLATLSACETGLGESAGGEGLLGLQRAFQLAGAKTVVASLWKVPDKATQMLMARFYEDLWQKKMSKLDALRESQLWMLHEGKKQPGLARGIELQADAAQPSDQQAALPPFYWAAFVLSGDWR